MTVTTAPTIIERETRTGLYDVPYTVMIVDHAEHGRLLLAEGYGGENSMRGGAYRWEHGTVISLQPEDTLESLATGEWNENATLYDAVMRGMDPSRPALEWSGHAVARMATGV